MIKYKAISSDNTVIVSSNTLQGAKIKASKLIKSDMILRSFNSGILMVIKENGKWYKPSRFSY